MNQNPGPTGRQALVLPGAPAAARAGVAPQPQDADATEVPSFPLQRDFLAPGVRLLRGAGNAALRSGALDQAQRDTIAGALAFAGMWEDELKSALRRAVRADTALTAGVKLEEALTHNDHFLRLVREQVLGEAPHGDAAAFVMQGTRAIGADYAGIDRILTALDPRLAQRVDHLRRAMWLKLGTAAAGVTLAIYLLAAFHRVTQGGIAEVARQLQELSRGNLRLRPRPWGRDEIAQLMDTLGSTLDALRRTVGQVRAGAGEIDTASREVTAASMDLSRRTEESAAHLQRPAASMAQIGRTLSQSASSAGSAAGLVGHNAQVAAQGSQVVDAVVQTMGSIPASTPAGMPPGVRGSRPAPG
jgi:methyl-accepting chemotaxis protein